MNRLIVPVEEFTTPNPITAREDTLVDELGQLMKKHGVRHIPIVKAGAVVGVVSDRDLRVVSCLSSKEKNLVRAGDIMVPEPVTVSSDMSLEEVAFEMSERKIGSVLVRDENDEFLGIFTVTDALNALIEISRSADQ